MNQLKLSMLYMAVTMLLYLCIWWPLTVGAQDDPLPTPEISATWWWATPTPTPVIVRPFPLGPCKISPGCALLPIVVTP